MPDKPTYRMNTGRTVRPPSESPVGRYKPAALPQVHPNRAQTGRHTVGNLKNYARDTAGKMGRMLGKPRTGLYTK